MDRGSVVLNWANDTKDHLNDKNRGPVLLQNLIGTSVSKCQYFKI